MKQRTTKAALKEFEIFPEAARSICLAALTIAADGAKAGTAKPMHGWARAFKKKSTQGIKTLQREIDLIKDRLKRLK